MLKLTNRKVAVAVLTERRSETGFPGSFGLSRSQSGAPASFHVSRSQTGATGGAVVARFPLACGAVRGYNQSRKRQILRAWATQFCRLLFFSSFAWFRNVTREGDGLWIATKTTGWGVLDGDPHGNDNLRLDSMHIGSHPQKLRGSFFEGKLRRNNLKLDLNERTRTALTV